MTRVKRTDKSFKKGVIGLEKRPISASGGSSKGSKMVRELLRDKCSSKYSR